VTSAPGCAFSQNHDRDVDRKDALIHTLDRFLDEADEQLNASNRASIQMVDQLIDLQDQRIHALEKVK